MTDMVTTQITASALAVYGIELLKKSPWFPWIHRSSDAVNRVIGGTMAVATALGIHMKFDSEHGTLLITGLTLASVAHFGFDWARSFVFQEMIYKGVVKPHTTAARPMHATVAEKERPVAGTPVLQSQSQAAPA